MPLFTLFDCWASRGKHLALSFLIPRSYAWPALGDMRLPEWINILLFHSINQPINTFINCWLSTYYKSRDCDDSHATPPVVQGHLYFTEHPALSSRFLHIPQCSWSKYGHIFQVCECIKPPVRYPRKNWQGSWFHSLGPLLFPPLHPCQTQYLPWTSLVGATRHAAGGQAAAKIKELAGPYWVQEAPAGIRVDVTISL